MLAHQWCSLIFICIKTIAPTICIQFPYERFA